MNYSISYPSLKTLFRETSFTLNYLDVKNQIVRFNIKPDTRDESGKTLLFYLLDNSNAFIILSYLREYMPDISIADHDGETVFFHLHCLVYNSTCDRPDRILPGRAYHSPMDMVRMIRFLMIFDDDGILLLRRNKKGVSVLENLEMYREFVQKTLKHKPWDRRLKQILCNIEYMTIPVSCHINHKCTLFNMIYEKLEHL